ncbi:hypothetical protein M426DRAFT_52530 [Hypoxylon sp. CI-4A]|nr:hypothetical protein M426DRAFT_52530 [Hypoxylon sp. CI-4A]
MQNSRVLLLILSFGALALSYVPEPRSFRSFPQNLRIARGFPLSQRNATGCKCIPGDSCWPSSHDWATLNGTVHGGLITTIPVAHVCHGSDYDEAECGKLRDIWATPAPHIYTPGDIVAPYFQNASCDPFTPQSQQCTLGNYPVYSINVTGASDIIAGFKFAKQRNIRLSIKNTGQDFLGKSSGKGSLSLWTTNLKSSAFIANYTSPGYWGPALKLGAGLHNSEAALIARQHNVRLVGGSSPTVGVAGGFTSGGGHSPLMGHYGLAADNVLEWEVVTPRGKHVVAKPEGQYADLYWALSGGGAGTWGVVLSVTAKAHPDGPVGGAQLVVPMSGLNNDTFWSAVTAFHTAIPDMTSDGIYMTTLINNDEFTVYAATSPDKTADEVKARFSTWTKYLDGHKIPYSANWTSFDNYYDHLAHYFGPYPFGTFTITQITAGRFVPRSVLKSQNATQSLVDTLRSTIANGHFYISTAVFDLAATASARASHRPGRNAVRSSWSDSNTYITVIGQWDWTIPREQMAAREDELTSTIMPAIRAITPSAGAYLNEANFADPNWQEDFYGPNYPRLSQIKKSHDPESLLYARTAVGSEKWEEDWEGRLCPVA